MSAIVGASSAPLSYAWIARYSAGRASFPVSPSAVLYSQFEHVSGYAAPSGGTVGIDRLEILNALIDRLESIKSQPLAAKENSSSISPERADALIKEYGQQLHTAAAAPARPYAPAANVLPGTVFSVAA